MHDDDVQEKVGEVLFRAIPGVRTLLDLFAALGWRSASAGMAEAVERSRREWIEFTIQELGKRLADVEARLCDLAEAHAVVDAASRVLDGIGHPEVRQALSMTVVGRLSSERPRSGVRPSSHVETVAILSPTEIRVLLAMQGPGWVEALALTSSWTEPWIGSDYGMAVFHLVERGLLVSDRPPVLTDGHWSRGRVKVATTPMAREIRMTLTDVEWSPGGQERPS